jgi:alkyl hydroperoxide reductase subunit F
LKQHVKDYDVDIMNLQRADALIPERPDRNQAENGAVTEEQVGDHRHRRPLARNECAGREGISRQGVAYCPHCDGPLFKGKRVAVIGGGNSGVEAAIDLAGIVGHVTLLEFDKSCAPMPCCNASCYSLPNVTVIKEAQTTEVTWRRRQGGWPQLQGSRQR